MNGFADRGLDEDNFSQAPSSLVSSFDAFPKTKQTYLTPTRNGTLWTIVLSIFCLWLTSTEFWRYWEGKTTHSFTVEKGVAHDMQINIDIVVLMKCEDLDINVQDASGDRILAGEMLTKDMTNWRDWAGGVRYSKRTGQKHRHAEMKAVPQWVMEQAGQFADEEDVHDFLAKGGVNNKWMRTPKRPKWDPGNACRIYGSFESNKVQGDFHITARGHGYADMGEHLDHSKFNFSHHINDLSFGPRIPELADALDNAQVLTEDHFYKYQYYLSIVPTIYTDRPNNVYSSTPRHVADRGIKEFRKRHKSHHALAPSEPEFQIAAASEEQGFSLNPFSSKIHTIYTNQYSVNEQSHAVDEGVIPGIYFKYDIEPILLTVVEESQGFLTLIVRCINVIAGVMVCGTWVVALSEMVVDSKEKVRRRATSSAGGLMGYGDGEKKSGYN